MPAFTQITDDAFPGAKSIDFIGQRIVYVEPFGRYWGWSDLVDATSWNSLETAQAETSPDRIQGLCVSHNEVLIFGERTIEPWAHAPTETAVFQLQTGSVIESGCASGKTIQRLDNSVFYLTNTGQVARLNGYTPQVVSTVAMEAAIRDLNWSRAFAFTWEDSGHAVYYITFPGGQTWGYDVRQGRWHRRESYGLDRWRINALCKSNGDWYAGDFADGRIYQLDWRNVYEGCEIMPRKMRTGVLHNDTNRMQVHALRVLASSSPGVDVVIEEPYTPPAEVPAEILITGSAKSGTDFVFANSQAVESPTFVGIPTVSGADLDTATCAFYDTGTDAVWAAVSDTGVRYSTDAMESWDTGTISGSELFGQLMGGPGGWLTVLPDKTQNPTTFIAETDLPLSFTATAVPSTFVNGSDAGGNASRAPYLIDTNGKFFLTRERIIMRSDDPGGPYVAIWDADQETAAGRDTNAACILGWYDLKFFDDEWYAVIEWDARDLFRRYRVIKSSSLTDWTNFDIVVDIVSGDPNVPAQLCVGGGQIVCYNTDGTLWTSANGWASPISTGLDGPGSGAAGVIANGGRRIVYAGRFYIIGDTDKLVTFFGTTVSDLITLPIEAVRSIATDYVTTEVDVVPDYSDPCEPMEGGFFQVRYSNDGANNWSNWRDFAPPVTGDHLQTMTMRRLGMARHRVWEFMDTSNRPQELLSASIILE